MQPSEKSGFTLVEFILYTGILAICLSGIVSFMYLSLNTRVRADISAEVESAGLLVLDTINQTIRNSQSITAPTAQTTTTSLALTGNTNKTFDLSDNQIHITIGASPAVALTSNKVTASALSFTNTSLSGTTGSIKFSFTLAYNNPGGSIPFTYSRTFHGAATLRRN
jgi:type II secretory pathway pseudopilin PulG